MVLSSSKARERFVTAAARLFSERGYKATTVGDVQLACGLTAGSGALYKHFASKQELLEAVVDRHVHTMDTASRDFAEQVPAALPDALRFVAVAVRAALERDRDVLRVLLRDLDDHPALRERMWTEVRTRVYDEFARWLADQAARGAVRLVADARTTAAVLLASLTAAPILDALIGHVPGDVGTEDFLDTWVRCALDTLTPVAKARIADAPPRMVV